MNPKKRLKIAIANSNALGENIIQWVIEVIEKAYPRMYKSHVDYVVPHNAQDPDWDSQVEQLFKAK